VRRLALALILGCLTLLSGCANATEYQVLDRFYMQHPANADHTYFLWLKPATGPAFDHWVDKGTYDRCQLGDRYIVRRIGKDECAPARA
jgi:hypothetical protein